MRLFNLYCELIAFVPLCLSLAFHFSFYVGLCRVLFLYMCVHLYGCVALGSCRSSSFPHSATTLRRSTRVHHSNCCCRFASTDETVGFISLRLIYFFSLPCRHIIFMHVKCFCRRSLALLCFFCSGYVYGYCFFRFGFVGVFCV